MYFRFPDFVIQRRGTHGNCPPLRKLYLLTELNYNGFKDACVSREGKHLLINADSFEEWAKKNNAIIKKTNLHLKKQEEAKPQEPQASQVQDKQKTKQLSECEVLKLQVEMLINALHKYSETLLDGDLNPRERWATSTLLRDVKNMYRE